MQGRSKDDEGFFRSRAIEKSFSPRGRVFLFERAVFTRD